MHTGGEVDSRGTYTVLAVARITNMLTPELCAGAGDFLLRCQSYEGGFGGEPGNEAHGGYNFCALAGLVILGQAQRCDLARQLYWLQTRQVRLEGGFSGRTNKLVDSCYSFWQGAAIAAVQLVGAGAGAISALSPTLTTGAGAGAGAGTGVGAGAGTGHVESALRPGFAGPSGGDDIADMLYWRRAQDAAAAAAAMAAEATTSDDYADCDEGITIRIRNTSAHNGPLLFNQHCLQRYILYCAQNFTDGGLRDKPGKSRDFYHTCYSLSGLSVAQGQFRVPPPSFPTGAASASASAAASTSAWVLGDPANVLEPTSAIFNIGLDRLSHALGYFYRAGTPCSHAELLAVRCDGM
jgi:protein farnesyltransferase subunit beta